MMEPIHPKFTPSFKCWDCGAENQPDVVSCWLCHREGWRGTGPVPMKPLTPLLERSSCGWIIGIGLIAVAIGIYPQAPVATMLFLMTMVPALLIAVFREPADRLQTVFWFSFMCAPLAIFVSLFVAFWIYCRP